MSESATSARKVTGKERTAQALELRKAGLTYAQIADRLGYADARGAHNTVKRALDKLDALAREEAEEVRAIELQRLDRALAAIWAQVLNGNLGAIDRMLRIQERRARYQGLDAPAKTDITSGGEKIVFVWDDGNESDS